MIRPIYLACVDAKLVQNLDSDLWILSMREGEKGLEVAVFNRLFDDADIQSITFIAQGDIVEPLDLICIKPNVYHCTLSMNQCEDLRVYAYQVGDTVKTIETVKPIRLERDMLSEKEVSLMSLKFPDFEVMPSFDAHTWQCLCSYVNQEQLTCKRCGRLKHDNKQVFDGDYRTIMIESALTQMIQTHDDVDSTLYRLSREFRVPLDDLQKQYQAIVQKSEPNPSEKKHRVKPSLPVKWVLIVCLILGVGFFVGTRPELQRFVAYHRANLYLNQHNYEAARDIYARYSDYKDSDARYIESLFMELNEQLSEDINSDVDLQRYFDKMSGLDEIFGFEQIRSGDNRAVRSVIQTVIDQYLSEGRTDLALRVLNGFTTDVDDFYIATSERIKQIYLEQEDYESLLENRYMMHCDDCDEEYTDYTLTYLNKTYLPLLEDDSTDSETLFLALNKTSPSLFNLIYNHSHNTLDTVYDIFYRTLLKLDGNQLESFDYIKSILYGANYKDSKQQFTGNFVSVVVEPLLQDDSTYAPNPFYPVLAVDTQAVTFHIETVGEPLGYDDPDATYVINSNALGYSNHPINLVPGESQILTSTIDHLVDTPIDFEIWMDRGSSLIPIYSTMVFVGSDQMSRLYGN